jgi:hypothetical protein
LRHGAERKEQKKQAANHGRHLRIIGWVHHVRVHSLWIV